MITQILTLSFPCRRESINYTLTTNNLKLIQAANHVPGSVHGKKQSTFNFITFVSQTISDTDLAREIDKGLSHRLNTDERRFFK